MPQNVLVSVLGEGKYLTALVRAILEKNIIPTRFLFLSALQTVSLYRSHLSSGRRGL